MMRATGLVTQRQTELDAHKKMLCASMLRVAPRSLPW